MFSQSCPLPFFIDRLFTKKALCTLRTKNQTKTSIYALKSTEATMARTVRVIITESSAAPHVDIGTERGNREKYEEYYHCPSHVYSLLHSRWNCMSQ